MIQHVSKTTALQRRSAVQIAAHTHPLAASVRGGRRSLHRTTCTAAAKRTTMQPEAAAAPTPTTPEARGDPPPAPMHEEETWITSQDYGNIVAMEHINLEVPDLEVARLFYSEGLGLTLDPSMTGSQRGGSHVMWYNVGRQQLHIVKGARAQHLPRGGAIGLVLPDVARIATQLEGLQGQLGSISVTRLSHHTLEVIDPFGVMFIVHDTSEPPVPAQDVAPESANNPRTPVPHIAYLLLPCFQGTAAHIANFYATQLGALVRVSGGGGGPSGSGRPAAGRAEVHLGVPGTRLIFTEQPSVALTDEAVAEAFEGWHVAFYVADFSGTYNRLRPVLFNSHPYRDKVHSFEDALRNRQIRFQDIRAVQSDSSTNHPTSASATAAAGPVIMGAWQRSVPAQLLAPLPGSSGSSSGQLLYRISHEVRSLSHPFFLRPLFNRSEGGFV